jgi:hypothetical protein
MAQLNGLQAGKAAAGDELCHCRQADAASGAVESDADQAAALACTQR